MMMSVSVVSVHSIASTPSHPKARILLRGLRAGSEEMLSLLAAGRAGGRPFLNTLNKTEKKFSSVFIHSVSQNFTILLI